MKRRPVEVLATVALSAVLGLAAVAQGSASSSSVKHAVDSAYASFATGRFVPGMAIAVVTAGSHGHLTSQTFEFGDANLAKHKSVTNSTQFEIGSETKVFTAAILADAIGRKIVSLDTPVQTQLPRGVTAPIRCGQQMTYRELASHRSGLPRLPFNYGPTPTDHSSYTTSDLWTGLETTRLRWCPGSHWLYSNFGFGLLGTILAGAEHNTFAGLVSSRITKPLKMNSTELERSTPQLATGYCRNESPAPAWDNSGALAGGGGLISSIDGMSKLIQAELGSGPSAAVKLLQATQTPIAPGSGGTAQMGMGWQIYAKPDIPGPYLYKNGGTNGMHSVTVLVPDKKIGVTILSNGPFDPSPVAASIVYQLLRVANPSTPSADDQGSGC